MAPVGRGARARSGHGRLPGQATREDYRRGEQRAGRKQARRHGGRKDGARKRTEAADTALAERVKTALGSDPSLRALAVDVAALGNAVTLHGTADNSANRDKASLVALGVQGVNSVENRIVIVRGS